VSTEDSALGTIIGYYNDNAEEYYFVSIVPDGKVIKVYDSDEVNIIEDSGSGSVTPDAIVNAIGQMDDTQKAQTISNLSAQSEITASGMLKGDGNGNVSAAVEGTDYGIIPAVTNVDDGKFARVVNGAWSAVTVPEASGNSF
ncbi:MAG: hypothetical protein J6V44_09950, partial [Methanobrevibacter sp.]|nr:hypothetical protein [Methanobrevibacter sp.]